MKIGSISENKEFEKRIAITPEIAKKYKTLGFEVSIIKNYGSHLGFNDNQYKESGVKIISEEKSLINDSDLVVQLNLLSDDKISLLKENQSLIGIFEPYKNKEKIENLIKKNINIFSLELLPRITRAQSMDILSSQANLAGYKAVILAANYLPHIFPLMMTASGTIRPAKVLVLGAGVAGLQAIATAKRLGAIVYGYDIRPIVKEQVESLGARFLETIPDETNDTETKDGYAQSMSEDFYSKQRELLTNIAKETDVIITTAAIPGKKAPVLINKEMVKLMPVGSVIVDLAAANGGNCELTKENEIINEHNVTIIGTTKIQSAVPKDASQMYSQNIANILLEIIKDGDINIDMENPIISNIIITKDGNVINSRIQQLIEDTKQ